MQDMTSGSCSPRAAPPLGDDKRPITLADGKGRTPSAAQRRAMRECGFKSAAGLELADELQCQVRLLAEPTSDSISCTCAHQQDVLLHSDRPAMINRLRLPGLRRSNALSQC